MSWTSEYTVEVALSVRFSFPLLESIKHQAQMADRIDALARLPRPVDARPVECSIPRLYRVGSGATRILYQVLDEERRIVVLAVGEV